MRGDDNPLKEYRFMNYQSNYRGFEVSIFRPLMVLFFCLFTISCSSSSDDTASRDQGNTEEQSDSVVTYKNPVFEPILADPSVIQDGEWFYAYGTEDDWGDGEGNKVVPIVRSKDLVNWDYIGTAFDQKPDWKPDGGIWAPAVTRIGDKYYMYYSYSVWADPNPGVGLAIADDPYGPFVDQGKIYLSKEAGIINGIDPFYGEDEGHKYLVAGSYGEDPNEGIYAFLLTEDGREVVDFSKKVKIAAGDFEAPMIYKKDGYYYFFGSKGNCCEGADSKYQVRVARSESFLGPYLDKEGNPITERGNGTLLIESNAIFAGPGHNADEIITDSEGTDWLLYHGIKKNEPMVSSGANRRSLMLDKITWDTSGWPEIEGTSPSTDKRKAPVFKE